MLLLMTPRVVLLSVCIRVGGCGCPVSSRNLECAEFGFGRGRHDCFDELGNVEYSAVVCRVLGVG